MDTLREAPFGQLVRFLSRNRLFQYPEEKPGFVLPDEYKNAPHSKDGEKKVTIVTWYGPKDRDNPRQWRLHKKIWVVFAVMFYTVAVYIGSAIFAYAVHDAAKYFKVSDIVATLTLTMFVLGYAVGPLFLAPLSELAFIGRNPPYIFSLGIFCVLQIPSALSTNLPGLLVLRFIAGFVGSPPLATGGASVADVFNEQKASYAVGAYGLAGGIAPAIAPFISGYAVMNLGWRWAFWELLILSSAGFVVVMFGLPETSADNVLYRRAVRLRKLTGNDNLRSAAELADAEKTFKEIMWEALVRPMWMTISEPIVLAIDLYIGLTYAILYSFFESFPWVFYEKGYNFNLGASGLPFLAVAVGGCIAYAVFCIWLRWWWEPAYVKAEGKLEPEAYLPLSIVGAICFPICLFWFAWSANRTHWIVPTIAAAFFGLGDCFSFMPYINYLTYAYPAHTASALASNDFVRSIMGAAMPIVAYPLFNNLGIDWGNSLIGFLTVACLPLPFVLIKFGPWLRARSPMASEGRKDIEGDEASSDERTVNGEAKV
ncbi:Caffeine resistance protein 5 [Vanrija pseudolonga]|uniref:Caffeine resistance protein 5 n=1 Tax=Vanrija pseudolonga TaxID=143232 RepID=A0AAF1BNW9_9TREE|nr:Caffeine resistance protein 5 [Vanrija pseudolonga]